MQVSLLVWLLPSLGGAARHFRRAGLRFTTVGAALEDATGFSDSTSSKAMQASVSVTHQ